MTAEFVQQLRDLDSTKVFACRLGSAIRNTRQDQGALVLGLEGTLGAGKTQLIRFLAEDLGIAPEEVTSPTYVLLQRYVGEFLIYHADFYRLENEDEVWDLGLDELYEQPRTIVLLEWSDKYPLCLPEHFLRLRLEVETGECRSVRLEAVGSGYRGILEQLKAEPSL